MDSPDFLQAVTLLATRDRRVRALKNGSSHEAPPGITCKRKDVLRLQLDEYTSWADPVSEGFIAAVELLHGQSIFSARDLPYRTQLVPLAAALTILGNRAASFDVRKKLIRWYWCGVFGELYGSAVESRFAKDWPQLLDWIDGGSEPNTVIEASFLPSRLLTLRTRNSAAYKGLFALLMGRGSRDLRVGEPISVHRYFDRAVDIHHIFPNNWCVSNGIDPGLTDSIVNKTALWAETNRAIGGRAPSRYLASLQASAEILSSEMDQILDSHAIPAVPLRVHDFEGFFGARSEVLLQLVEQAMEKRVPRDAEDVQPADAAYALGEEEVV